MHKCTLQIMQSPVVLQVLVCRFRKHNSSIYDPSDLDVTPISRRPSEQPWQEGSLFWPWHLRRTVYHSTAFLEYQELFPLSKIEKYITLPTKSKNPSLKAQLPSSPIMYWCNSSVDLCSSGDNLPSMSPNSVSNSALTYKKMNKIFIEFIKYGNSSLKKIWSLSIFSNNSILKFWSPYFYFISCTLFIKYINLILFINNNNNM